MKKLLSIGIILLLILSGCSNGERKNENVSIGQKRLHVVTTFYPMYYFSKKIAGNAADVNLLIPNGVEPHDWEPTAKDMASIQDSDVFVYDSRYFETWAEKVLNSVSSPNLKVVEASSHIQLLNGKDENGNDQQTLKDPHVWLSPVLAQTEIDNIAKAFEQKDPKNKGTYEKNAAKMKNELANLDQLYRETAAKAQHKEFVTQHAAFSYLAKQYGWTQIPIAGLSPDVEPTLSKLAELTNLTKTKKIKIIYFEGMTSSKVAKTLANEIHAKTEVLNPLEGLTKEDQKQGLDYLGVMKKNLTALKKTLYQTSK